LLVLAAAFTATGCASQPAAEPLTTTTIWSPGDRDYVGEPIAASALVFAPPVTINEPAIDLDRTSRQRSAFLGFDEGSVETYRITVDDRQSFGNGVGGWGWRGRGAFGWGGSSGWNDRYDRQVYSERSGSFRR
jgi:hypothetical protein